MRLFEDAGLLALEVWRAALRFATLIGAAILWATPFARVEAALMGLVITLMGFAGGIIMSAIKRDRGVKDYGSLIEGYGGILDRVDSLCVSASAHLRTPPTRTLHRIPEIP